MMSMIVWVSVWFAKIKDVDIKVWQTLMEIVCHLEMQYVVKSKVLVPFVLTFNTLLIMIMQIC